MNKGQTSRYGASGRPEWTEDVVCVFLAYLLQLSHNEESEDIASGDSK
jgi:hypothetical protein